MKNFLVVSTTILTVLAFAPKPVNAISPTECVSPDSTPGIPTALGCLSYYPESFIRQIMPWSVRLAGSIAFLLIIAAAFQHSTAAGDPEKMQKSSEMLSSAIAGLIIIIFATVLLHAIGVDILGLGPRPAGGSLGF